MKQNNLEVLLNNGKRITNLHSMKAYKLLAKLRLLTLTDLNGKLGWIGTYTQWQNLEDEEQEIINDFEFAQIWKISL